MIDGRRIAIVLAITGVVAAGLIAGKRILGDDLKPIGVGVDAPDFTAETITEPRREKSLAQYRGNVVMINLWATWCRPCVVEMPSIEQLHRDYGPRGLKIIAVSVDDPGTDQQIRDFARQYGLTFEILHDPRGQAGDVSRIYQSDKYPQTVIIGRDGIIRKKTVGATDWNSPANRALVERLLEERPEAD